MKVHITEAMAEKMADAQVISRLWTDRFYQRAEDAEAQAQREQEITSEVWASLEARYEIA